MLTYDLEQYKPRPLYESLYMCIRDDILSGEIPEQEKLPSKRSLSSHLNISVTTVENAYAQLMLEGYVRSEHGRGFFVNSVELVEDPTEMQLLKKEDSHIPIIPEEPEEPSYVIDFKANSTSLSLFPISTWSKLMRDVLSSQDSKLLETVPYNGILPLRKAIANHLRTYRNMYVNPEQIIIGAGTEYLYSRLTALFGSNIIMAIEDPGYKKFADISHHQGTLWDYIPIDESGMRVDNLYKSNADVIHVSPANHFPTGTVMPIQRRMELLEWANEEYYRYIIEDDYDSELRYQGKMIPTIYSMDNNEKVIYINTFSKSLVPSIRISYMVLPPLLVQRYRETLSFYSCTVSSFEQLTLAHFMEGGYFERHINRLKQHYKVKRDQLIRALKGSQLTKIARIDEANAGTHFLLHVDTEMNDEQIRQSAREHDINFAMLSDYEKHQSLKNARTLVINYAGLTEDKIDLAISILEEIFRTDIEKNS